MKFKSEQLPAKLRNEFLPVYLVVGDEALLVDEAATQIRERAFAAGVVERKLFHGSDADFDVLSSGAATLSLFAEVNLYEFRLSAPLKPAQAEMIQAWCEAEHHDNHVLITMPATNSQNRKITNLAWYKKLDQAVGHIGAVVEVLNVRLDQFPAWLSQRAREFNLKLQHDALQLLVQRTEGNLLAAQQELWRLSLVHQGETPIDADMMRHYSADNARFGLYDWVDAAIRGDVAKAIRMLRVMQEEGQPLLPILTAITTEIRTLNQISWNITKGDSVAAACKKSGVWASKQGNYQKALSRFRYPAWQQFLQIALKLDKMIKGQHRADPWLALENLCLLIAGHRSAARILSVA